MIGFLMETTFIGGVTLVLLLFLSPEIIIWGGIILDNIFVILTHFVWTKSRYPEFVKAIKADIEYQDLLKERDWISIAFTLSLVPVLFDLDEPLRTYSRYLMAAGSVTVLLSTFVTFSKGMKDHGHHLKSDKR